MLRKALLSLSFALMASAAHAAAIPTYTPSFSNGVLDVTILNQAITALNNITGGGTAAPGTFSTLSATGAVSGAGFTTRFAAPGPIGNTTPSTGAFTTLSASTSATLSPSGTVTISPTGALTVNPTAASAIDNATVGVTTPLAGKFTTLQWTTSAGATGAFSTDSGQGATATVCEDTTTHVLYFGSGAAGICKGTSSIRFKQNIGQIAYGLDEVLRLKPVSYYTKPAYGDPTKQLYGFLAEDMVTVMPRGVTEYDTQGRPSSVDYNAVIPVLAKAIQEQQAQIEQLKHRASN